MFASAAVLRTWLDLQAIRFNSVAVAAARTTGAVVVDPQHDLA